MLSVHLPGPQVQGMLFLNKVRILHLIFLLMLCNKITYCHVCALVMIITKKLMYKKVL